MNKYEVCFFRVSKSQIFFQLFKVILAVEQTSDGIALAKFGDFFFQCLGVCVAG